MTKKIPELPVGWAIVVAALLFALTSIHEFKRGSGCAVLNKVTGTVQSCTEASKSS